MNHSFPELDEKKILNILFIVLQEKTVFKSILLVIFVTKSA